MAERRMISKKIIDTDAFLDMPLSTQALYFHFIQNADDDGFVGSPNSIVRKIGANKNDYDLLIAKRFIITFETGICVIKHWRIHNYIQNDRYVPTTYLKEKATLSIEENKAYTEKDLECIQNVSEMDTQVSIGKNSIDKDRVSIESNNNTNNKKAVKHKHGEYGRVLLTDKEYEKLVADFGADKIEQQITLLDEYVESNNNKNKYTNFNLVLRKSINNGWFGKKSKPTTEYDVYDEF